jgi:hypothetical protein
MERPGNSVDIRTHHVSNTIQKKQRWINLHGLSIHSQVPKRLQTFPARISGIENYTLTSCKVTQYVQTIWNISPLFNVTPPVSFLPALHWRPELLAISLQQT